MVAKITTVFNQKGGASKTTTAMNLAGTAGMRGLKVLLVDGDEQGTATRWNAQAPDGAPFPAMVTNLADMGGKIHQEVRKHIDSYDLIVIDCPPALRSPIPASAMMISDLAIIPVIPSPADLWAAQPAKQLAEDTQNQNEDLLVRIAAVMVQRTKLAHEAIELLQQDEAMPLLKSQLGYRSAFKESQLLGGTVHRVQGAAAAIVEVDAFVDEVLELLNLD